MPAAATFSDVKKSLSILIGFLLLAGLVGLVINLRPGIADAKKAVMPYGNAAVQAFEHPSKIEVFQIDPRLAIPDGSITDSMLLNKTEPSKQWVDRFKLFLARNRAPESTLCAFDPGYVVRFSDSRTAVDVLLCFHCMQWAVEVRNGRFQEVYEFDKHRSDAIALIRELYPGALSELK